MANVFSMADIKNRPSRNGFDLSRKNLFTAKAGEILPVAVVECIPGDKHVIKSKWMTRTQPLNSAAYTRIKEYFDWYFVPTNLLWNKFNDFVTSMKDNNLKADSISSSTILSDQHPYVTLSQIWSYVNVMAVTGRVNFFGYRRAELTCKLLEYLGYGDFYDALQYENYPNDRVDAVVNIFPLLAYQKIYQDHFRDSQWEKAYAPSCNINYMTGASDSLNIPIDQMDYDVENMFDLRYANWNKDYFMGVRPDTQYGSVASVWTIPADNNVQLHAINFDQSQSRSVQVSMSNGVLYNYSPESSINNSIYRLQSYQGGSATPFYSYFDILTLRQAEAVQKMREVMQSHEQDYKSQLEARWNVSVSDAYSDRCKWLGGDSSSIDISEVLNTNLSESSQDVQANIRGKGVGVGQGSLQCNVQTHGYLVCMYHCVPVLDFSLTGVKKHNLKTLFTDYAQPELDKTGMVSIPTIELMNREVPAQLLKTFLGYAPQYYEYKTAYDECHGGFGPHGTSKAWVTPIDESYIKSYADAVLSIGRRDFVTMYFLKVPPAVLDPIFAVQADLSLDTDQFLINSYFDIKSVRNLDYNGLPY